MDFLINKYQLIRAKPFILIGLAIVLIFNIILLPYFPQILGLPKVPKSYFFDLMFCYSMNDGREILSKISELQLQSYKLILVSTDLAYLLFYGFFYSFIIAKLYDGLHKPKLKLIVSIPFIMAFFDLLENILLMKLLSNSPRIDSLNLQLASICTATKWSLAGLTALIILNKVVTWFSNRPDFSN